MLNAIKLFANCGVRQLEQNSSLPRPLSASARANNYMVQDRQVCFTLHIIGPMIILRIYNNNIISRSFLLHIHPHIYYIIYIYIYIYNIIIYIAHAIITL